MHMQDYSQINWPLPKMFGKEKYGYSRLSEEKRAKETRHPWLTHQNSKVDPTKDPFPSSSSSFWFFFLAPKPLAARISGASD